MAKIEDHVRKFQRELNSGTLGLALLAVMAIEKQPMYGYQIAKKLEGSVGGFANLEQGVLYPALRSMSKRGILKSFMRASPSGPARKYYEMTPLGKKVLKAWTENWAETRNVVDFLLGEKTHEK